MNRKLLAALGASSLPLLDSPPWFFPEGAEFGATRLWWGKRPARPRPHEGLDFFLPGGPAAEVRALAAGTIAALLPDFLGHSLWVRHPLAGREAGSRLYSVLAHLHPRPGVAAGQALTAGEVVGEVNFTRPGAVPGHLHLSLAWLPAALPPELLAWESIHRHHPTAFFDPLPWLLARGLKLAPPPPGE